MQQMSNVEAIKTYFNLPDGAEGRREIMELRKSLTKEGWDQFGQNCCKALGVEWKSAA